MLSSYLQWLEVQQDVYSMNVGIFLKFTTSAPIHEMCSWIIENRVRIQEVNFCSSGLGQPFSGPRVEHRIQIEIVPALMGFSNY